MRFFFNTFYKNPQADWRYILGFEPALMLPEDLKVYRAIQRGGRAVETYEPWIKKMRPEDRLADGRPIRAGSLPPLEWQPAPAMFGSDACANRNERRQALMPDSCGPTAFRFSSLAVHLDDWSIRLHFIHDVRRDIVMPIYEFACPKCRKIFNFLSKRSASGPPARLPQVRQPQDGQASQLLCHAARRKGAVRRGPARGRTGPCPIWTTRASPAPCPRWSATWNTWTKTIPGTWRT